MSHGCHCSEPANPFKTIFQFLTMAGSDLEVFSCHGTQHIVGQALAVCAKSQPEGDFWWHMLRRGSGSSTLWFWLSSISTSYSYFL
jgi:hypothetical protein